jgi:hypothetical protein
MKAWRLKNGENEEMKRNQCGIDGVSIANGRKSRPPQLWLMKICEKLKSWQCYNGGESNKAA